MELLAAACAAAEMALSIWVEATAFPPERLPVQEAVNYLEDWLRGRVDGSEARGLGDRIYQTVRASSIPTGTPERSAAFAAAHAAHALAFHLGQCRQREATKVFEVTRAAVGQASRAANWENFADWSDLWWKRANQLMAA